MKKSTSSEKSQLKEQEVASPASGKIRFFKSFEEAEQQELEQVLKQPPLERIKETVDLILRVYGVSREQLKNRTPKNSIEIVRYR